jgi:hypothetical protein
MRPWAVYRVVSGTLVWAGAMFPTSGEAWSWVHRLPQTAVYVVRQWQEQGDEEGVGG